MTTSFPRSLSRLANTKSEQLNHFVSNSVTRLLCFSSTQSQHQNPVREQSQTPPPQESLHDENKQSHEPKEEDQVVDIINKEIGEIGGPKGPEPTRYGDWERNGRCYDF